MSRFFENYCILPTDIGEFRMYDTGNEDVRLISFSPIEAIGEKPLLRIHSSCMASEVFGAKDCDCADQLHEAMKLIASEGKGLIIHIHQEGRGHGLSKKIKAVSLMQKEQCDTAESFIRLGFDLDPREYGAAIDILNKLGITAVRLISNNPRKKDFLMKHGISVETVHTHPKIRNENKSYLYSKNEKLGHSLPLPEKIKTDEILFYHSDQEWGDFANFSNHAIFLEGKIWKTVEHFYQAQKFHQTEFEEIIRLQKTPMLAKQKAHELLEKHPVLNWDELKEQVMYKGLLAKFTQNPELWKMLVSTGNKRLAEHTDLDNYWGDGANGQGKNRLGALLMRLRAELSCKTPDIIEKHRKNIGNYFKNLSDLYLLGSGAEGIVFSDQKYVFKSFLHILDRDWNFLKKASVCFGENSVLYPIKFFENDNYRFIRYKYEPSSAPTAIRKEELISFLKFCKAKNIVFTNIKPRNFIQLKSGSLKLIDYGKSIRPFSADDFQNSTKRAFLMWKYPAMEEDLFKYFTAQINNHKIPGEIKGWENFWNAIF